MFVATIVVTVVLAAMLAATARLKLSHSERVVASYERVGVPEHRLNTLATILLLAAVGMLAGLFWPPIGLTASAGLVIYFVIAMTAHLRAHDARRLATPFAYFALSVAVVVLRATTM